jgi:hypothetical protein
MTRILQSVLLAAALLTGGAIANAADTAKTADIAKTPAPIQAAAGTNCTYYSNASHTTVVGEFGIDCCNNHVARGVKTQFYTCSSACLLCVPPPQD